MENPVGHDIFSATLGGSLIGFSASLMLVSMGRITGISGILSASILSLRIQNQWRWSFLAGLISGGVLLQIFAPTLLMNTVATRRPVLIVAGLLVGFGSRLGGGCTSGHGICGVGRFSKRSIVATIVFLLTGILVATFARKVGLL
jgi:uncharacterized membrane protein YedE/YeeE